ncbi:hypothetical protein ACN47E_002083 [Coniothyrium glycines]
MNLVVLVLALAAPSIAAPIAQGTYNDYGSYENVPAPPVNNPPPPAAGYGSYGAYPAPAGGYGSYGAYKKE